MSVVKLILAVLLGLAAVGLVGLGAMSADSLRTAHPATLPAAPPVSLRAYPEGAGAVASVTKVPDKPEAPPDKVPEKTPEKQPEAEDAGAPPVAVKDAGAPPAKDAGAPAPAAVDAGAPAPKGKPDGGGGGPVVPPGQLNLRASDTADVFVDGRKVGSSPVLGFKVRPGTHRVRFDCYDSAGNAIQGQVQTVAVTSEKETDLDFTCPAAE